MNPDHVLFAAMTICSIAAVGLLWVKNPHPPRAGYTANALLAIGFGIISPVTWYFAIFGNREVGD